MTTEENHPLTMLEDLIDDYTFLFGTTDAVKHLVKDTLGLMAEHPSYTPDELYIALKTKPTTPLTLFGFPVVLDETMPTGAIRFGAPLI